MPKPQELAKNLAGMNFFIVYLGNDLQPLGHELKVTELKGRSLTKVGILSSLQICLKRFRPIWDDDDGGKAALSSPKIHKCMTCMVETGIRRLTNIKCLHCKKPISLSYANYISNEWKTVNVASSSEAPGSCKSDVDWMPLYLTVSECF